MWLQFPGTFHNLGYGFGAWQFQTFLLRLHLKQKDDSTVIADDHDKLFLNFTFRWGVVLWRARDNTVWNDQWLLTQKTFGTLNDPVADATDNIYTSTFIHLFLTQTFDNGWRRKNGMQRARATVEKIWCQQLGGRDSQNREHTLEHSSFSSQKLFLGWTPFEVAQWFDRKVV